MSDETKSFAALSEEFGLDDVSTDTTIVITCGKLQQQSFKVDRQFVKISKLYMRALEQDPTAMSIPCPTVEPLVFSEILNYIEHHKGIDPPVIEYPAKSVNMSENCTDPWDAVFVDTLWEKSKKLFYEVLNAANFLEIISLVHLCCCTIATRIKDCPLDNIRNVLVPEDLK